MEQGGGAARTVTRGARFKPHRQPPPPPPRLRRERPTIGWPEAEPPLARRSRKRSLPGAAAFSALSPGWGGFTRVPAGAGSSSDSPPPVISPKQRPGHRGRRAVGAAPAEPETPGPTPPERDPMKTGTLDKSQFSEAAPIFYCPYTLRKRGRPERPVPATTSKAHTGSESFRVEL